jgi:hypothetical protein
MQLVLNELIKVDRAFRKSFVAKLLGNNLSVRTLGALFHEVHHEVFYLNRQIIKALVFLIAETLSDWLVILLKENHTGLLWNLLILLLEVLKFVGHLFLKLAEVFFTNIADSTFVENFHCLALGLLE